MISMLYDGTEYAREHETKNQVSIHAFSAPLEIRYLLFMVDFKVVFFSNEGEEDG